MKANRLLTPLFILFIGFYGCTNKNEKEMGSDNTAQDLIQYQEKGQQLASSTQKVLATNLVGAIEKEGTEHALEFCNIRAIPLTDSMSTVLNAHIKRVTDLPRNINNRANEDEMAFINETKKRLENADEVQPKVYKNGNKVTAYYPIVTNQLCMQCHGKAGQDINEATLAKIRALYPEDKATGYKVGELRGLWVVEMEAK